MIPQLQGLVIEPRALYFCCFCPRRMRGEALEKHLELMHHNLLEYVAKGELLMPPLEMAEVERTKRQRDIPGQTFFPFLAEHWAKSGKGD